MPPHSTSLPTNDARHELLLYVNGKRIQIAEKNVRPEQTLLQFLRHDLGLTGTKLGCGEGGCECVANTSTMEEAISGLYEVQKALAEYHASQCGYCTPGFVMALYSMVKQQETGVELTMEDIKHGMDGNLCRCTGYRPILDVAKSFGNDAGGAHCKGSCPGCSKAAEVDMEYLHGDKSKEMTSCSSRKIREMVKNRKRRTHDANVMISQSNKSVLSFPKELVEKTKTPQVLQIDGKHVQWFAPVTMTHLIELKSQHFDAKISVGNSEMGIETKFKGFKYAHLIHVSRVPELVATTDVTPKIKSTRQLLLERSHLKASNLALP
ncbi:unnamed protein product [Peronospora belbahrii]|uniref:2Fe-2S ferredoxin-type domain-containing protein n=1 Tax=Peronospora belbahrii TaxID=622444 RepID=A0ABN8DFD7_9STRA|nr:unnamed protein product [Peronospora belbahrii]